MLRGVFPPPSDVAERTAGVQRVLRGRRVRRAADALRKQLLCRGCGEASRSACSGSRKRVRTQGKGFPSKYAPPPLVSEDAATVPEHLAHAACVEHPVVGERAAPFSLLEEVL